MRVSEYFDLDASQYELDFVNVDPEDDTRLYLNPHFLNSRNDRWSQDAYRTIRSFFQHIINLLQSGDRGEARRLFSNLSEPTETCLGMSQNSVEGSGIGPEFASDILNSIEESQAIQTGLVKDLGDTAIFVDGVSKDRMSDITANIIRGHLLEYTKRQCRNWDIPMSGTENYLVWSRIRTDWEYKLDDSLLISDKNIILIPKWIVSKYRNFNHRRYFDIPVVDHIQRKVENKTGKRENKKEIKDNLGSYARKYLGYKGSTNLKEFLRKFTKEHPEVFENFKDRAKSESKPLSNEEVAGDVGEDKTLREVTDHLISTLRECSKGKSDAHNYHKIVSAILEVIFYPDLINQQVEQNIYKGKKRVDITFENASEGGFFKRIIDIQNLSATYVFVECKNYSEDPGNPEVDQLMGRLSQQVGQVGILTCRNVEKMDKLLERCSDIFTQKGELIIPFEDKDLIYILNKIKKQTVSDPTERPYEETLDERSRAIRLQDY